MGPLYPYAVKGIMYVCDMPLSGVDCIDILLCQMPSVCLRLDVNYGGTNHDYRTHRYVILQPTLRVKMTH